MNTSPGHDEILELLPDFIMGRLDPDARPSVLEHLAQCHECAAAKTTLDLLASRQRPDVPTSLAEHPSAEEIVEFAVEPSSLDEPKRSDIRFHLKSCAACKEQVEATRAVAEHLLTEVDGRGRGRNTGRYLAAAAAAVFVLLAYPSYLGLIRLPQAKRQVAAAEESVASAVRQLKSAQMTLAQALRWGGPTSLPVLRSETRGEHGVQETVARAGQQILPLGVEFMLPADVSVSSEVKFEIRATGEQALWTGTMPVSEAEESLSRSGMILLLVPASVVGEGERTLDALLLEPGGQERLLTRILFRIQKKP